MALNNTINQSCEKINCLKDSFVGDLSLILLVYSIVTTLVIFLLIWILKNNFQAKRQEVVE